MNMEYVRLGDICTKIGSGATPAGGKEAYKGGDYKLVRSQNVLDLKFSKEGLAEINDEQAKKLKNVTLCENDVLLNITGDSVARSCLVPKEILPARVNQHVSIIRPQKDILDSYYLLCYLQVNKEYLLALASTGSTRNAITKEMIEKLKIQFPPLSTQQKISSILSTYDTLIENNAKRIRLLEQMAENLYKEWFVRFRFPGHENAEMENGLPKGWKVEKLFEVADVLMGQSPESKYYNEEKQGLPFHQGVGSYGDFYLNDSIYSTEGKRIAKPFSIIFSVRAPVGRININLNRIILGRGVASINHKNGYNAFLLWCLKDKFAKEDSIGNGSIFTSVTKDELLKQKITIPTRELLEQFNSLTSNIEKGIRVLTRKNALLTRQRDLLLPRLMSGKLEVTI